MLTFLGYYLFYRLLTSRSKLDINCYFVFDYNITYYNTLKLKKELFAFACFFYLSFFITLINLGAQIIGSQTRYTVDSFQPTPIK